ncbi:subclass B3 metallo-beta-lactamase [Novosphingobium sp. KN65.2]|uniref:MIM family subclass B3 metallo-beta-lactamase n=1 Tax=Novosphingobium sp. KN65.2 TaxID=1478134 RepID=UPI0005DC64DB|nr:subclass B3 metallo-beta-lactamase [Novosphingobium sp. KN65.2]CDO37469.1 Beta-lactamase-like protein [Novosphingobium sp. KN65.2]
MSRIVNNLVLAALVAAATPSIAQARDKAAVAPSPKLSSACAGMDGPEGWSHPAPPAHIYGNTWYVGTCGIASVLVTSDEGHVLIDSGPADAAPLVLANIRKLGFDPADVRWILTSHEHHDHVGSIAELQKATGAQVAALASARQVLESGKPSADDPQSGQIEGFAPAPVARRLVDGDSVTLGRLALTVHATPAHSPGSASWTWQACDDAFTCKMIAYADSATTISADGYRFSDHPDRIARIQTGLSRIAQLPCDILVTPHPSASNLFDRLSGKAPLVNAQACAAYSQAAGAYFAKRLAGETGEAGK